MNENDDITCFIDVAAKQVLLEHGLEGKHSVTEIVETTIGHDGKRSHSFRVSIVFNDPKDQFVYELKGGDSYFTELILMGAAGKWHRMRLHENTLETNPCSEILLQSNKGMIQYE